MVISLFGLGKAGLPFACVIARSGLRVVGVDLDAARVRQVNRGQSPLVGEPGLPALLSSLVARRQLVATTDAAAAVREASTHIVLVPLFIDAKHNPDFSHIKKALVVIGKNLKKGDLVVIETTLPVGTTRGLVRTTLERASGLEAGSGFFLAYSPERTMSGYALSRYADFPKILSGINPASTKVAMRVYSRFSRAQPVSSVETAEMVKVAEGIYRDVNVALSNELLKAAQKDGIDFWEVRAAANHEFCNLHEPGNGTGGHCIPVYPWFLIKQHRAPLVSLARRANDGMAAYFALHAVHELRRRKVPLRRAKVAVLGLTYRSHVKETYNSRAFALVRELKKKGVKVYGHDFLLSAAEVKKAFGIPFVRDFGTMDLLLVHNKNPEYRRELLPLKDRVIDTKNILA